MKASPGFPVPPPYGGPAVRPPFTFNLFRHFPGRQGFPVPPGARPQRPGAAQPQGLTGRGIFFTNVLTQKRS